MPKKISHGLYSEIQKMIRERTGIIMRDAGDSLNELGMDENDAERFCLDVEEKYDVDLYPLREPMIGDEEDRTVYELTPKKIIDYIIEERIGK